jgi:hypothetical protein
MDDGKTLVNTNDYAQQTHKDTFTGTNERRVEYKE